MNWYRKTLCLLILLSSLSSLTCYSIETREYKFRTITPIGGLGYDGIKSIEQDHQGFLWTVMDDEVFRFDGYQYKRYAERIRSIAKGVGAIRYYYIIETHNTELYLSTSAGVFLYDKTIDNFKLKLPNVGNHLFEDKSQNIWITGRTLECYNSKTNEVSAFKIIANEGTFYNKIITSDNDHTLYISTDQGKIYSLQSQNSQIDYVFSFPFPAKVINLKYHNNLLWVLTENNGLFAICPQERTIKQKHALLSKKSHEPVPTKCLQIDKENTFWIGTQQGLIRFIPSTEEILWFQADEKEPFSLPNNSVWSIINDSNGNLWIGTFSGRLSILILGETTGIRSESFLKKGYPSYPVSSFAFTNGMTWIGSEGGGLFLYNNQGELINRFIHSKTKNSLRYNNVKSIIPDKQGNLWIAMYKGGIDCRNINTGRFTNYNTFDHSPRLLNNDVVKLLAEQDSGMWVSYQCDGEFLTYFSFDKEYSKHFYLTAENNIKSGVNIVDFVKEASGNLWILSSDNAIYYFDIHSKMSKNIKLPLSSIKEKENISIRSILYDKSRQSLWFGTQNRGLLCYCPKENKLKCYDSIRQFGSITINSLQQDRAGSIWLGTNSGLFRFMNERFYHYNENDNLQGMVFLRRATAQDADGNIFFGNTEGYNVVSPEKIKANTIRPNILISDILINNESIFSGKGYSKILANYSQQDKITLAYDQNNIRIELSSDNFLMPEKNRFRYRLTGYDNDWQEVNAERRHISYSKLPSGRYKMEIVAYNNDGLQGDITKIDITVRPAPWNSIWAYLLYLLIGAGAISLIYNKNKKEKMLQNEIYLAECRKRDQEENHQGRLRFFTNITHDFRTPLTLILGTLDSIEQEDIELPKSYINSLKNNSQRLLKLVNEVIDFRTIENGMMAIKPAEIDFNTTIRNSSSEFREYAYRKNIKLRIITNDIPSPLIMDPEIVEKIVINLIDNAVKYTFKGNVEVQSFPSIDRFTSDHPFCHSEGEINPDFNYVGFVVRDSGIGISEESINQIFDRFYRAHDPEQNRHLGSGIGLSLVKSLVLLHQGTIRVCSTRGVGTDIFIALPTLPSSNPVCINTNAGEQVIDLGQNNDTESSLEIEEVTASRKNKLLLVEDNDELRELITHKLSSHFDIISAANGHNAFDAIVLHDVDIILSDWMMPECDGIDLCSKIKQDERFAHIPFILMSVKSSNESRLEGVTRGVDAYIEKPINFNILYATMRNMLKMHNNFQRFYAENYVEKSLEKNREREKNVFMNDFVEIVKNRISSTDIDIDAIAAEMKMSRRKLYSLVKENSGKSIVEFIRMIRIRSAARMMLEENLSTKEVMVRVGIESASHFSKSFKEEFGMTPSLFFQENKRKK